MYTYREIDSKREIYISKGNGVTSSSGTKNIIKNTIPLIDALSHPKEVNQNELSKALVAYQYMHPVSTYVHMNSC